MSRAEAIAEALLAAGRVTDLAAGNFAVERIMVDTFPGIAFDAWNSRPCQYQPTPDDARVGSVASIVLYLILKVSDVDEG